MTAALALLTGAAVFALALALLRRPALGPPPRPVGARWRALQRARRLLLSDEERRMAGVLGWPEGRLLAFAALGAGLGVLLAASGRWLLAALAAFLGAWYPRVAVRREYRRWRARALAQLPALAEALQSLFDAGLTVPAAIREAAALVDPPLRGEVERLAGAIVAGPDEFRDALAAFGARTMSPEAAAFAQRLAVAWEAGAPGGEVFAGLGRTLGRLREAEYMRRSKALPLKVIAAAMLGLLNAALAVGVPLWVWSMSQLSRP